MGSYGRLWRARLALMRPQNCAMAAVGVLVGIAMATDGTWPTALRFAAADGSRGEVWIGAPAAAFLVTGFGNVLNDVGDHDTDRRAHPARPLPAGRITRGDALVFSALLLALGLFEATVAGGAGLLAFAAFNVLVILAYEHRAKAWGLPGNILVAWLVASTFLFGGYAWRGLPGAEAALPLAVMAGLATLARELMKDTQDMAADTDRRTFPMRTSPRTAWAVAALAVAAAVSYSVADAWTTGVVWWPWLAVPAAFFAAGIVAGRHHPERGQRWLKAAMVVALLVYLAPGAQTAF